MDNKLQKNNSKWNNRLYSWGKIQHYHGIYIFQNNLNARKLKIYPSTAISTIVFKSKNINGFHMEKAFSLSSDVFRYELSVSWNYGITSVCKIKIIERKTRTLITNQEKYRDTFFGWICAYRLTQRYFCQKFKQKNVWLLENFLYKDLWTLILGYLFFQNV